MIQDTGLGQEMFISAYEKLDPNGNKKLQCYRYTDDDIESEFIDTNIPNQHLSERTLVYCVSPPGENTWSSDPLVNSMDKLELKETNTMTAKKFPLPNIDHTYSIVKFYNDMAETVRVGQLIEIIGIRGQNLPKNEQTGFESALDSFADVPVLHAIAYNPVQPTTESILPFNPEIRASLIDYIASATKDTLAAEFILLQLLSRVTVKNRGLKIGHFTLNIAGFPTHQTTEQDKKAPLLNLNNPASKALSDILDQLNPHTVQLPLTIAGLNKTRFSPKSINENLEAGLLQLIDGTVVLVDETVLDEGQLVDPGVRNFQALQDLIQNQTLKYEFPYSQYEFDTDLNILTLSNTKSMLPNHCSIRIVTNPSIENSVQPTDETLDRYRQFIHSAKYASYDIPEQVSEYIQTSFVNERKAATVNKTELPTQEELMLRMNLARLVAVSFGETSLTEERYDHVICLDKQRKERER
ncbi:putative alanine racemase-domain-containing protein [Mucor mucedo]|uniref:putative alanine racemase-domain-containing protein n=1 Tax=Mucor mucedo TaxID=29922 RepID=UPI002220607A|nr:putative alanine racemase-domain-containing protein [Mucor mucedo]KAI7895518.1 putative alanine racemase-domain-containing protein [Mucor mucedo]